MISRDERELACLLIEDPDVQAAFRRLSRACLVVAVTAAAVGAVLVLWFGGGA